MSVSRTYFSILHFFFPSMCWMYRLFSVGLVSFSSVHSLFDVLKCILNFSHCLCVQMCWSCFFVHFFLFSVHRFVGFFFRCFGLDFVSVETKHREKNNKQFIILVFIVISYNYRCAAKHQSLTQRRYRIKWNCCLWNSVFYILFILPLTSAHLK